LHSREHRSAWGLDSENRNHGNWATPNTQPVVGPSLFSTPQDILAKFAFYADSQDWPVSAVLDQLHQQMPTDHVSSLDKLLTLDVWLGDLATTFDALAGWIKDEQHQVGNGFWRYHGLKSDAKHLRLLDPQRYGRQPSVRWVELDMTANWDKQDGVAPNDVRDAKISAGLQVMTAFAVHSAYPLAIDGKTIPSAWLPGLEVFVSTGAAWQDLPLLGLGSKRPQVHLDANWGARRLRHYAAPVVREL
jgi:hypothetical protein